MLIPCKQIASIIQSEIFSTVQQRISDGVHPKLVTILHGQAPEQLSFVSIKKSLAAKLNLGFEFIHYQDIPPFETFLSDLKIKVDEPQTTGVIIQLPLPITYDRKQMYEVIPIAKDIEGHKPGSPVQFPLSLSVLTGIKYVFGYALKNRELDHEIMVNFEQDIPFFQEVLAGKTIVIAGRGDTGGKPIGNSLARMGISYIQTHSATENVDKIYQSADIIITATGRKILLPSQLKKDVILLNVGLRQENGKLRGDYDEQEIQGIASFYTGTPGGLGPLDVLYLYKNLIDASYDLHNNGTNSDR